MNAFPTLDLILVPPYVASGMMDDEDLRVSTYSAATGWSLAARRRFIPVVALVMATTGCTAAQNNQNTLLGALGGGVAGSAACLLARGNAVACALAGIGGAVIGGAVGHAFDERDRARQDAAVRQAYYDQRLWQAVPGPLAVPQDAPVATAAVDADADATTQAPAPTRSSAARRQRQQAAMRHSAPVAPPKQVVAWQNPDTTDSGAVVPLRTFAAADGGTCKVWRQEYINEGKQYSDNMQGCPKADGTFDVKPIT